MTQARMAFTAVFLKASHGYIGFVEELPNVNSHGRTLEEARQLLRRLMEVVFDEERRNSREMTGGMEVLRESLLVPISGA